MSKKSKGTAAERELMKRFWEKGWACIRAAGSGCSSYPSPDLLVGNIRRKLAVECKATGSDSVYIPKDEIEALRSFGQIYGAETWVAARFDKRGWFFMNLEDLKETDTCFAVRWKDMEMKGLSFDELISQL